MTASQNKDLSSLLLNLVKNLSLRKSAIFVNQETDEIHFPNS